MVNISLRLATANAWLMVFDWRKYPFQSPEPEARAELLGHWLQDQNADVIFIQELIGEEAFEFLKQKMAKTGVQYSAYVGGGSDLAVFSRYPITEHHFLPTRWQGSEHERCQLISWADYRHGFQTFEIDVFGTKVFFANMHTMPRHARFENARLPSDIYTPERFANLLEAWDAFYQKCQNIPCVVGGDMNFGPDDDERPFFEQLFGFTNAVFAAMQSQNYKGEFSTYTPKNKWVAKMGEKDWSILDHIYFNHFVQLTSASIVAPPQDFSDHWPVVADIQIPPLPEMNQCLAPNTIPVSLNDVRGLIRYFENVNIDWVCDIAVAKPEIHNQRSAILEFLRDLERSLISSQ